MEWTEVRQRTKQCAEREMTLLLFATNAMKQWSKSIWCIHFTFVILQSNLVLSPTIFFAWMIVCFCFLHLGLYFIYSKGIFFCLLVGCFFYALTLCFSISLNLVCFIFSSRDCFALFCPRILKM